MTREKGDFVMIYWHGLFSVPTWSHFVKKKEKTLGYRARRERGIKNHMKAGDVIIAYVGNAMRWVGALRVTGEYFVGRGEMCHGVKGQFPIRVPVEPISKDGVELILEAEMGVPRDVIVGDLKKKRNRGGVWPKSSGDNFKGWVRGSPQRYNKGPSPEDAELVIKHIREAVSNPIRREIPKRLCKDFYNQEYEARLQEAKEAKEAKGDENPVKTENEVKNTKTPKTTVEAKAKIKPTKAKKKPIVAKTRAAKVREARLTASETKKIIEAFKKGQGGPFPAEMTEDVIGWGATAKSKKDTNFGLVLDGVLSLKMDLEGKVLVT